MADFNDKNKHGYQPNRGGSDREPAESPKTVFENACFKSSWITNEADEGLPVFADKIGKYLAEKKLSNSKIRSIYGEIKRIQMNTFEKDKTSFYLLRPKVAYALGRERDKNLKDALELFKLVFEEASKSVIDGSTYKNFCNLIEAVLAYHRFHGGKD